MPKSYGKATNLGRYLTTLAVNPKKVALLKKRPKYEMKAAGLSLGEMQILKRADPVEIRKHLMAEESEYAEAIVIVVTIL